MTILHSRTGNTRKLAYAIAEEMGADIYEPGKSNELLVDIESYDVIGFGSGIYSEQHNPLLLELAGKLPNVEVKPAFIFSTCGFYTEELMISNHTALRELLFDKGFTISGEFGCPGLNKNSFFKIFGGINKGDSRK